jgi:hypothetical protein
MSSPSVVSRDAAITAAPIVGAPLESEPRRTFSVKVEKRSACIQALLDERGVVVIHADPLSRPDPDGGQRISMGFPVLMVSGWVAEPEAFAAKIAELLAEAQL